MNSLDHVELLFRQADNSKKVNTAIVCTPYNNLAKIYALKELLGSVGHLWEKVTEEKDLSSGFDVKLLARNFEPIKTIDDNIINPEGTFEGGVYDLVIIPDLSVNYRFDIPNNHFTLEKSWVSGQVANGAMLAIVCTGLMIVADLELFRNEKVALHWGLEDHFRSRYPNVEYDCDSPIELSSGGNIITTGACSAWEEMAKYLIVHYCGYEELRRISSLFMLGNREYGLRPFAKMVSHTYEDEEIQKCINWLEKNISTGNIIERLTECSGLNPRTLKRRFKAVTEKTPIQFVKELRVERSKVLLVSTDEPVDIISYQIGYRDSAYFRGLFKNLVGLTPYQYRKMHKLKQSEIEI